MKQEVPVYNHSQSNFNELNSLLEIVEKDVHDDIEFTYSRFPRPYSATTEGLIKRENDSVSGDIPFNENKNGRIYLIGDGYFEIHKSAIQSFVEWNTNEPEKSSIDFDKRFVKALLLNLLSKDQLNHLTASDEIISFIRGKRNSKLDSTLKSK